MKKRLLFFLLICSSYAFAFQTTLTTSIYADEVAAQNNQTSTHFPTIVRRVRFINQLDTCTEIEIALATANEIFSSTMNAEGIDLVTIEAVVEMGSNPLYFTSNELCKVSVVYSDTIINNTFFYYFNNYSYNNIPIIIPKTIQNQCKGESKGPSMTIQLNPAIAYYYGNSDNVPPDKYDAVTVLLRALAIGCGIQSTLNPNTMQFGVSDSGQTYINAFDAHIYNDSNYTYSDVVSGNISSTRFLANRSIYAEGYSDNNGIYSLPVLLYNDLEFGAQGSVSSNTLNTVSPWGYTEDEIESGFYDLLDPFLISGYAQRTMTPYTMSILRGLGWRKTIPVGPEAGYLFNFYNSRLICSSDTLLPDHTYMVELSNNDVISNPYCEIESMDSSYIIGTFSNYNEFSYHSIPENVQWRRNPITKNIIGHIHGTTSTLIDMTYYEAEKIYDIEVPYKPNKIQFQKSESTTDGYISLNLNAFANGSNTYTVTYTGVTSLDNHTFTTTANALDTILIAISGTQLYNMSIYGSNNEGNSDTCHFSFGFSAHPTLNMSVSVNGNILRYDLSYNGTVDLTELNISLVQITDPFGGTYTTPQVGSGEPINISFLSRGNYFLTVVADGNVYSRLFIKR